MSHWIDRALLSAETFRLLLLLLDAAVKGIVLTAIAYAAVKLMRRTSAAHRHIVLLLAMFSLLALPVLSAALPQWKILPNWFGTPEDVMIEPSESGALPIAPSVPLTAESVPYTPGPMLDEVPILDPVTPVATETPEPARKWTVRDLLAWLLPVWMLGTLVALSPLILGTLVLWKRSRKAVLVTDGRSAALLKELCESLRLRCRVTLLRVGEHAMPLAWGILHPKIMLPGEAENWPGERLRGVLIHELAHIKHRDCLAQLVSHVACALHWFNPFAWMIRRRMVLEREQACDDIVLNAGLKSSTYAQQLLEIASGPRAGWMTGAAAIAMARASSLEGRLLAILDNKRSRRALTRVAVLVGLVLTIAVAIPLAALHAQETKTESTENDEAGEASISSSVAVFPNGGTIEIVGLSKHPSEGQPWWKPDGESLDTPPVIIPGGRSTSSNMTSYEIIYRANGFPKGSNPQWIIRPGNATSFGMRLFDGHDAADMIWSVAHFPKDAVEGNIKFGASTGAWQKVAENGADGGGSMESYSRGGGFSVSFTSGYEVDGKAAVTVTHTIHSKDTHVRVIAVDETGQEHPSIGSGSTGNADYTQLTARFDLPLARVNHFRFQTRPIHWVEFKNVSLKSGRRTDVQVVVQARGTGQSATEQPSEADSKPISLTLPCYLWPGVKEMKMLDFESMKVVRFPFPADPYTGDVDIGMEILKAGATKPRLAYAADTKFVPTFYPTERDILAPILLKNWQELGTSSNERLASHVCAYDERNYPKKIYADMPVISRAYQLDRSRFWIWMTRDGRIAVIRVLDTATDPYQVKLEVLQRGTVDVASLDEPKMLPVSVEVEEYLVQQAKSHAALAEAMVRARAADKQLTDAAAAPRENPDARAWGAAVEGVQVRLRADKKTWNVGECPRFEADLRNTGTREFLAHYPDQFNQFEVDGKRLSYNMGLASYMKPLPLEPGSKHESIRIPLTLGWKERQDQESSLPKPGKHTVRFAFGVEMKDGGEPLRVISNPVEITVEPRETFLGLDLTDAPRTTKTPWDLSALRNGIVVGRHPEHFMLGTVCYLPDKDVFYIQHDPIGSSTLTYYGPFKGEPWNRLGIPESTTITTGAPTSEQKASFDRFSVALTSTRPRDRTIGIYSDGSYSFSMNQLKRAPDGKHFVPDEKRYRVSLALGADHLRTLDRLLAATEWLAKPGRVKENLRDGTKYSMTVLRGDKEQRTVCYGDQEEAYANLIQFLERINHQEWLAYQLGSNTPDTGHVLELLKAELSGVLGRAGTAKPYAPALDYARLLPAVWQLAREESPHQRLAAETLKLLEEVKNLESKAWGEAVEGVQVRLRVEKKTWKVGECPRFEADLRNTGTREFVACYPHQSNQFEVDGKRLSYNMGLASYMKPLPLEPGSKHESIRIPLTLGWKERKDQKPSLPKPGTHTVRFAFSVKPKDGGEPLRAISNAIEITVKPRETFLGLDLTDAPRTTKAEDLPDLWEERPPGSKSYELRDGVVVGRHPEHFLLGDVYYLPTKDVFYVQHDQIFSSTRTFYGPFDGKPWKRLGIPESGTTTIGAPTDTEKEESGTTSKVRYHVVQVGDTLAGISEQYYGTMNRWRDISDANKGVMSRPDRLKPGMKLRIPTLHASPADGDSEEDEKDRKALSRSALATLANPRMNGGKEAERTWNEMMSDTRLDDNVRHIAADRLSTAYMLRGDWKEVGRVAGYELENNLGKTPVLLWNLARSAREAGQYESAEKYYARILDEYPDFRDKNRMIFVEKARLTCKYKGVRAQVGYLEEMADIAEKYVGCMEGYQEYYDIAHRYPGCEIAYRNRGEELPIPVEELHVRALNAYMTVIEGVKKLPAEQRDNSTLYTIVHGSYSGAAGLLEHMGREDEAVLLLQEVLDLYPDLEYADRRDSLQRRLNTILARAGTGINEPPESGKKQQLLAPAIQTVATFMTVAKAGDAKAAEVCYQPGRRVERQASRDVKEFSRVMEVNPKGDIRPASAYLAKDRALVISNAIHGDPKQEEELAVLMFSLERWAEDDRSGWVITEIDIEPLEKHHSEIDRFLAKNSYAEQWIEPPRVVSPPDVPKDGRIKLFCRNEADFEAELKKYKVELPDPLPVSNEVTGPHIRLEARHMILGGARDDIEDTYEPMSILPTEQVQELIAEVKASEDSMTVSAPHMLLTNGRRAVLANETRQGFVGGYTVVDGFALPKLESLPKTSVCFDVEAVLEDDAVVFKRLLYKSVERDLRDFTVWVFVGGDHGKAQRAAVTISEPSHTAHSALIESPEELRLRSGQTVILSHEVSVEHKLSGSRKEFGDTNVLPVKDKRKKHSKSDEDKTTHLFLLTATVVDTP